MTFYLIAEHFGWGPVAILTALEAIAAIAHTHARRNRWI